MPPLTCPDQTIFDRKAVHNLIEREHDDCVQHRLRAILMLMDGTKQADAATTLNCSTASVRTWVRKWNQGGYYSLLDDRRGSLVTQTAREAARRNGFDIIRIGGYFRMQPLATNVAVDEDSQPIKPIYLPDWDRPTKTSLQIMLR